MSFTRKEQRPKFETKPITKLKGLILAAGRGARLDPLTRFRAKPAIPFLNRPLIDHSLEFLRRAGIEEIAVNLHHLPETVRAALSHSPSPLVYSYEKEILGTGGALRRLTDFLQGGTFVVVNGKIYFEQELAPALDFHRSKGSLATLALAPRPATSAFNPVWLDGDGRIVGFGRKDGSFDSDAPPLLWTRPRGQVRAHVFTGVHILEPEIFEWLPRGFSDTVADLYPRLIGEGLPVQGFVSRAYWCECSTAGRYLEKSLEVLRRKGLDNLLAEPTRASCRLVVAGGNTLIDAGSRLRECILWEDCLVGRDCCLSNVILAGGLRLPSGISLRNCILTPPLAETAEPLPEAVIRRDQYLVWPLK